MNVIDLKNCNLLSYDRMELFESRYGVIFSDIDMATFIWNDPNAYLSQIIDALKQISLLTNNTELKKQILMRIDFENLKLNTFKMNELFDITNNRKVKYLYLGYNDDSCLIGTFQNADIAEKTVCAYVKNNNQKVTIEKHPLIEDNSIIYEPNHSIQWNPHFFGNEEKYNELSRYNGNPFSQIDYSADGKMMNCWSIELLKENVIDKFDNKRFENRYVELYMPFDKGDIVKDIVTDQYYIVSTSCKEWNDFQNKIKQGSYVDYCDSTITLYQLAENGYWSHAHLSVLYLDKVNEIKEKNIYFVKAYISFSNYLKYGENDKQVIETIKDYKKLDIHKIEDIIR